MPWPTLSAGGAWRLMRATAGHAALAGFPARPGEPLSNARFQSVRALAPDPAARVLLAFDGAHPALIEAPHALAFMAGLGPAASDFTVSGAFLPLFHQIVKVLGRGTAAGSLAPGDRYQAPAGTGVWRIEDLEGREVADWFAVRGITAFVLRYRLGEKYQYPIPLEDAQRAVRYVRANAAQYQIDPDRIGIWGFSAGGHLASTAGTHFDDGKPEAEDPIERASCRPDFLILAYPVVTFHEPSMSLVIRASAEMHYMLGGAGMVSR